MNITDNVINDLLPLYFSDECSQDTKKLVNEFLKANPAFAEKAKQYSRNPLPATIPQRLTREDEMETLARTQRLSKRRTWLMGLAIFVTLAPFSFLHTDGKFFTLIGQSPMSAALYGVMAVVFWTAFVVTKRKTAGL